LTTTQRHRINIIEAPESSTAAQARHEIQAPPLGTQAPTQEFRKELMRLAFIDEIIARVKKEVQSILNNKAELEKKKVKYLNVRSLPWHLQTLKKG
jgi:hypothetical protein